MKFHHTNSSLLLAFAVFFLPSHFFCRTHTLTTSKKKIKFFTLSRSHTFFAPEASERENELPLPFSHSPPVCVCVFVLAQRREQRTCTPHEGMSRRSRKNILTFSQENSSQREEFPRKFTTFSHTLVTRDKDRNTHTKNSPHGQCETLSANVTFLSSRQKISTPRRGHCFFAIWLFS